MPAYDLYHATVFIHSTTLLSSSSTWRPGQACMLGAAVLFIMPNNTRGNGVLAAGLAELRGLSRSEKIEKTTKGLSTMGEQRTTRLHSLKAPEHA